MSPSRRQPFGAPAAALLLGAVLALGSVTASGADDPFARAAAAARERAEALLQAREEGGEGFPVEEVRGLLATALIDLDRFASDGGFRERVLAALPAVLPAGTPEPLRDLLLHELETGPGLTFEQSEALEVAWGAARRTTAEREAALPSAGLSFPDEASAPIEASLFSFPSRYLNAGSALDLLAAVHRLAPERELVVLVDLPLRRELESAMRERGTGGRIHWAETFGRPYSPWPRDPFSTARTPEGTLALVARPAAQEGREGDLWMARELLQNLPPDLDRAWGGDSGVVWGRAPFFFHNGHVLMAGGAAWTSLHGLERSVLEVLGLDRVPVESFATPEGVARYAAAARSVMDEMAAFYGKPVRLVHPLPEEPLPPPDGERLMRRIGGGAGVDLDALVTLLPGPVEGEGAGQALVGDLEMGRRMVAEVPPGDLASLRETYGLEPTAPELRKALAALTLPRRAAGLQDFLDLAAGHLERDGLTVRRVPLLFVPVALLEARDRYDHGHFLVGWNNVVLAPGEGGLRAEGFASGIPAGDALARKLYAEAGTELTLLPPLVASVVANGGYRCASNQVRRAAPGPTEPGR